MKTLDHHNISRKPLFLARLLYFFFSLLNKVCSIKQSSWGKKLVTLSQSKEKKINKAGIIKKIVCCILCCPNSHSYLVMHNKIISFSIKTNDYKAEF